MKIGIIGFGRIGRLLTRQLCDEKKIKIKLIIDTIKDIKNLAYLVNYDSNYGVLKSRFYVEKNFLLRKKSKIPYLSTNNISSVNWKKYKISMIIDCTGDHANLFKVKKILKKYPKIKCLVTHSNSIVKKDIVYGLNHQNLQKKDNLISSSICDVNAISHPINWIEKHFKILSGSVTTLHPWLSYQNLLDGPAISTANKNVVWKDYALGRSSVSNLIPKNTTAVTATEKVLPAIAGKLLSFSFRIPTQAVCAADITLRLKEKNFAKIKKIIIESAKKSKIVKINYDQITSIDLLKSEFSATIDMRWLKMQDDVLKIVLWYDNEWGYTSRVKDIIKYIELKKLY